MSVTGLAQTLQQRGAISSRPSRSPMQIWQITVAQCHAGRTVMTGLEFCCVSAWG